MCLHQVGLLDIACNFIFIIQDFGYKETPDIKSKLVPLSEFRETKKFIGQGRGIQGHHNSCYMDATLFSMFAFCNVFDYLLDTTSNSGEHGKAKDAQHIIKDGIVNPLRKYVYFCYIKFS